MKVVITGHTQGLGKAIADYFTEHGHEVVGLSRATGFDLATGTGYFSALQVAQTAELFVNNANVGKVQTQYLKLLKGCLPMITCGSMAADFPHLGNYHLEKRSLEDWNRKLDLAPLYCPSLFLKMGYLEGSKVEKFKPISYADVVRAIEFWLTNKRITLIEFDNQPI